jgi:hypothetical protein
MTGYFEIEGTANLCLIPESPASIAGLVRNRVDILLAEH